MTTAGGVKCWGNNGAYQIGDGTARNRPSPVEILASGMQAVAPGGDHTCALTTAGGIKCWGANWAGQLGDGTNNYSFTPKDIAASGYQSIAAGSAHTCAVTTAGALRCWGYNDYGQLGDGSNGHARSPITILASGVLSVSANAMHTCAVMSGGGLKCWGNNTRGQLGDGTTDRHYVPFDVAITDVASVALGQEHTCVLTTGGAVKCWGANSEGQLGNGSTATSVFAPQDAIASGVQAIDAGGMHTCALTSGGGVKCWGANGAGQLGNGSSTRSTTPQDIFASGVVSMATGYDHSCAVASSGSMTCWGNNSQGQLGIGPTAPATGPRVPLANGVLSMGAGEGHTCAVTTGGGLKCWGANAYGQLGNGTSGSQSGITDILASGVASYASRNYHGCAVTTSGGLKCWGMGWDGQIGDNSGSSRYSPVDVLASGVVSVATGYYHSCAVMDTGGVKCWGRNYEGVLGTGDSYGAVRYTPYDLSLTGIASVAAGHQHTCVLSTGGAVHCWGSNGNGALGDGTGTTRFTPVLTLANGAQSVAAGQQHTCALTTVGGVKCWGSNGNGQLGDGTNSSRFAPVDILLEGIQAIAAGHLHTCALTTAGGIKCWGYNGNGQLGDGSQQSRNTPLEIFSSGFVAITAGAHHTCAIATDGAAKCWGRNSEGQLGVSDSVQSATATPSTVRNDFVLPETAIVSAPAAITNNQEVTFIFSGTDAHSGVSYFECSYNGSGWFNCGTGGFTTYFGHGRYTWDVRAVDAAGNVDATPSRHEWFIDQQQPETYLTETPASVTSSAGATFVFSGDDYSDGSGIASFRCTLDGGTPATCASPLNLTGLAAGSHTIEIAAVDVAGNIDPSPQTFTWLVDQTRPDTAITGDPGASTTSNSATFSFTGTDAGGAGVASFVCSVDGATPAACTSPFTFNSASFGSHTFSVAAVDGAGNVDSTPASHTWLVADVGAPETTITSSPAASTNVNNASFAFTGDDGLGSGVASFKCSLDGALATTCNSPQSYSSLAPGSHTFTVFAIDQQGNQDPTPASFTWTIDVSGPTVSITVKPVITSANQASYSIGGACSEDGRTVTAQIGSVSASGVCGATTSGQYATTGADVSALGQGEVSLTASITDAAGNSGSATDATTKDSIGPALTIGTLDAVNNANKATYALTGACEATGGPVSYSVSAGASVSGSTACAAGNYATPAIDLTGLTDGAVSIQVTQADSLGNSVTTLGSTTKDVVNPSVTIDTPAAITSANQAGYGLTGTCSESGRQVSVAVGSVNAAATCGSVTAGLFAVTGMNVTALPQGATSISASLTDAAGNSATASASAGKDSIAGTLAITSPAAGTIVTINPTVSGNGAEAGAAVTVHEGSGIVCTATASGTGAWTCATTLGLGSHTLTASQVDLSGNASTMSPAVSFNVKTTPVIALSSTPNPSASGQTVTFTAIVSGGPPSPTGTIVFMDGGVAIPGCTSLALGAGRAICAIANLGAGSHSVTAEYSGDDKFDTVTSTAVNHVVNSGPTANAQVITFASLADRVFGEAPFTVSATGGASGNPVVFSSLSPAVCTTSGTHGATVTLVGSGICMIAANQAAGNSYAAAAQVTQFFLVSKGNQAIVFPAPASRTFGDAPFVVSATGGPSASPVVFSALTPEVCTSGGTNGATITIVAAGTCSIVANQAGDGTHSAASPVIQSFTVARATQAITFGTLANRRVGDAPFAVSASSSSGLPVVIASSTSGVCTVSGNTVTILAAGGCSLTASQAGNANYLPASAVQAFTVDLGVPGISLNTSNVDFGGQSLRTTSRERSITVTNTGHSTLSITGLTLVGPYTASHSCSAVAPLGTCAITISFTPVVAGFVGGTVVVAHNAGGGTISIALTGAGELSLVTHFYDSILARLPDAAGKDYWEQQAERLRLLGVNVNETWYAMALAFFNSAEYAALNTTDLEFLGDLYLTFFNRAADASGLAYWTGLMDQGMSRENVLLWFLFSVEFDTFTEAIFGDTAVRGEVDLVLDMYRGVSGRLPDTDGLRHWVGALRAAQCAGGGAFYLEVDRMMASFFYGAEYLNRKRTDAQYVADLYNVFMRRGADLRGEQFWVQQLHDKLVNREQVLRAFLYSTEVQARMAAIAALTCIPPQ